MSCVTRTWCAIRCARCGKLYDHLRLGEFERYEPRLREYLAGIKGYETNRYELTPAEREEITRRWGPIIRRYGYETVSPLDQAVATPTVPAAAMVPLGVRTPALSEGLALQDVQAQESPR